MSCLAANRDKNIYGFDSILCGSGDFLKDSISERKVMFLILLTLFVDPAFHEPITLTTQTPGMMA